jgi:phospholipid transport system substrate-binding protein
MRRLLWVLVIITSLVWANPALAQGPTEYIRGILDQVMAIQNNPSLSRSDRRQQIHQIIRDNFDFNTMAKTVLGSSYSGLSAGQVDEFNSVFSYLFQDSYASMVLDFLKQENIQYGAASRTDGKARVDTVIERPNENIPVTYLLDNRAAGWKMYDVIVDGVSILHTYRDKFSEVIRTKGFNYIIQRMNEQRRAIE